MTDTRDLDMRVSDTDRYLRQYRDLQLEIEHLKQMAALKREHAMKITRAMDREPVSGGRQEYDSAILEVVELQAEYERKEADSIAVCNDIERSINAVQPARYARILRKYYVLGLTDEEIGLSEHLSRQSINQDRRAAVTILTEHKD